MIGRIKSFLLEKRFPHFFPYTLSKKYFLKLEYKEPEDILFALTFDIEYNPKIENKHVEIFLRKFRNFLEKNNCTLFVCGEIVKESKSLKKLKKCEIGLHGYAHELWGDEKWWLNKKPIDKGTKINLIKLSIESFKEKKIKRPVSFRAPYMLTNSETLKIIESFGFFVDSSAATYLNENPLPYKFSKVIRVPVSVNPIPEIKRSFFIPFAFYKIFNMQNFCNFDKEKLVEYVRIVTAFQEKNGIKPNLVFLAHPYEFFKIDKLDYCSPKNYSVLKKLVKFLRENYDIKMLNIKDLAKMVLHERPCY